MSPVRADGYVPVDPDTNVVHDTGVDIDHTKCGRYLTWCKSITLIPITYDWCHDCYPEANHADATRP